ncbi:putative aarF domain-containing protein kinase 1 [Smittium culicis]|uniref:Putative aarF domain-containing protein kinase 1 n=1 Tax=Smittium culicis TaxID=133412 RepID=A0A1R1YD85_9FUNG|nr:putative aarF domain-containing protein kinase 1 [Smittium culicis]
MNSLKFHRSFILSSYKSIPKTTGTSQTFLKHRNFNSVKFSTKSRFQILQRNKSAVLSKLLPNNPNFNFTHAKYSTLKESPIIDNQNHENGNKKNKKSSHLFSKGLVGVSTFALVYYLSNNIDNFEFAYIAAKRSMVSIKAAALVSYNYYFYFPDLLSEQDALKYPQKNAEILQTRSNTHYKCAEIVRDAMLANGGIYIKLGQHVSAMSYVLPIEWTSTMIPLQDKCNSSSIENINRLFKSDLDKDLSEYFSWFDPEPIGVASLAQVHKAQLSETGEIVAVKVQHSDVLTYSLVDIKIVTSLFKLVYKLFPDFQFMWLADEMNLSLPVELDFTNEMKNSVKLAENFKNRKDIPIAVPRVINATKRILIMEFINGRRVDDLDYLKKNHIDPASVSKEIARAFGEMTFNDGFVHCDPHAGNLFIRPIDNRSGSNKSHKHNFELILLDHGLYRTLSPEFIQKYALLWTSLIKGNVDEIKRQSYELTGTDLHVMLSCIVTGQSWTSISEGKLNEASVNITFSQDELIGQNDKFFAELSKVMSCIPRDLVLMIKTNDLVRQLDRALFSNLDENSINHATMKTWMILSDYCISSLYKINLMEYTKLHKDQRLSIPSFFSNLLALAKIRIDYWLVKIPISIYYLWLTVLDYC